MEELIGRQSGEYDKIFIFRTKSPPYDGSAPDKFLDLLNAEKSIGRLPNRLVNLEAEGLRIYGKALEPNEITKTLSYWNSPDGIDQARCHIPHHGLAVFHNGCFDWFASICFICSNITIGRPSATKRHRIMPDGHNETHFQKAFMEYLNGLVPEVG